MRRIIDAAWRRIANSRSTLRANRPNRLWCMGLAAAAAAAVLYPSFGVAQWAGHQRVIIDLGPERPGYAQQARQPLRPSEVAHILRDWGLRLGSGPSWSGTSYQAIAKDAAGRDVFVAVDPYDGRILRLDLADRVLGGSLFASTPRGDERVGGESVRPLPELGKPRALSRERWNARAPTRIVRPPPAASPRLAHRAASRRLATVETGREPRTPKPVAAAPSRARSGAGLGAAAKLTPAKTQPAAHELRATPPAAGVSASAPAAAPSPTPSTSEAPKLRAPNLEAQPSKPEIPKDAGFD
jgi:hypothetical protein